MPKSLRQRLFLVLRIVVCAGALWIVLRQVDLYDHVTVRIDGKETRCVLLGDTDELRIELPDGSQRTLPRSAVLRNERTGAERIEYGLLTTWRMSNKPLFLLCLAVFAPVPLIGALRFKMMLNAQEIALSYWESLKLSLAGNFLNFLPLPGSTGGDVYKAYYVTRHTDRKTEAVLTVLLDRIIGLAGLIVLVAIVLLLRTLVAGDVAARGMALRLGLILLGMLAGTIVFLSPRARSLLRGRSWRIIPAKVLDHVRRADAATQRMLRHRVLVSTALGMTILIHFLVTSSVVLAAVALRMSHTSAAVFNYFVWVPLGNVVSAVPISFQGAGTMEWVYFTFLADYGSTAQLLCLALALRLIHLFWALPGALVTLTGAYRPQIKPVEGTAEPAQASRQAPPLA